jgi:hypothetical protein
LGVQRTARHQKRKKTQFFLQSLTRVISQTNEPISEKLRRIEDQVTLNMYDENIWNRAETKNVTLGGIFKIPTKISPKPRILGTKKLYEPMGHYNRSSPLKFHDDPMHRKITVTGRRKVFNRK